MVSDPMWGVHGSIYTAIGVLTRHGLLSNNRHSDMHLVEGKMRIRRFPRFWRFGLGELPGDPASSELSVCHVTDDSEVRHMEFIPK